MQKPIGKVLKQKRIFGQERGFATARNLSLIHIYIEDISFKEANGQGYVKEKAPKPSAVLSPITGDKKKDLYYIEKKIRQADGTYLFKEDTELRMTDGQSMVISKKPVVIKAEGKKLTFASIADNGGAVSTVKQNSKNKINITAKELVVKAESNGGRSEGISLDSIRCV